MYQGHFRPVPLKKYVVDARGRAYTAQRELAFELRRPEPTAAAAATAAAATATAASTVTPAAAATGAAAAVTTATAGGAQRKVPARPAPSRLAAAEEWLVTLARQAAGRGQGVIVFCSSKRDCEITAQALVRAAVCAASGAASGGGGGGGGGALYDLEAACPDGATKGLAELIPHGV